jgi:transposase
LTVCPNTQAKTLDQCIIQSSPQGTTLYTDGSNAYNHLRNMGYSHATVNHGAKEYARDDDGDGFCEVHCNTLEGLWAALRTFLRPFRGVHKRYLAQYVAMFEWEYNLKKDFKTLLRAMLLIDTP